jgi:bifunctional DNA-binding transcriptional regulator/antitoxin component of YhaV-PrlF toxin-antitoxin module
MAWNAAYALRLSRSVDSRSKYAVRAMGLEYGNARWEVEPAMQTKLVQTDGGLALVIPSDIADRYHLKPDGEVELTGTDEGLVVEPLGVEPWFSFEWERALDAVLDEHREALELASD